MITLPSVNLVKGILCPQQKASNKSIYLCIYRRNHRNVLIVAQTRRFSDFIEEAPRKDPENANAKTQQLIERAASVLAEAREALENVRSRDPADAKHRRTGADITVSTSQKETSKDAKPSSPSSSGSTSPGKGVGSARARASSLTFSASDVLSSSTSTGTTATSGGGSSSGSSSSFDSSLGAAGGSGPPPGIATGIDSWFGNKVDSGPVRVRSAPQRQASSVAVMDRTMAPASLEFGSPQAPAESGAATIFPEEFALRFQSDMEVETISAVEFDAALQAEDLIVSSTTEEKKEEEQLWEKTSGEEVGPDGYWYRWTQITGKDAAGTVAWSEKWWEVSDWKGMKEMGAEKWGYNANGDAWRETWRETISIDAANKQPTVERSAHKWAKNGLGNEWEEKWGEKYWSKGGADKYADKWAKEGDNVWHEKWGENYDGNGGCTKWTDRWAERGDGFGGSEKWGDKWEEKFAHGRGGKQGETWSETAGGERYQRWWGENHLGDGFVQKYGNSNTGEHWDVTEQMDTYYNPIPHFGYDLALAHSPQLKGVPMLPRDKNNLEGGWDSLN